MHNNPPEGYSISPVLTVLDTHPMVSEMQLDFWEWMADYYMCTPGEVYRAALPSGLKLESEKLEPLFLKAANTSHGNRIYPL